MHLRDSHAKSEKSHHRRVVGWRAGEARGRDAWKNLAACNTLTYASVGLPLHAYSAKGENDDGNADGNDPTVLITRGQYGEPRIPAAPRNTSNYSTI